MRGSTAPARVCQVRSRVELRQALGALLAAGRSGQPGDLHLHQALGGKADHLAQQIGIWGYLHERAKVHHLVGHRWFLETGWCQQPDPTGESPVTTAKPSTRYGAIWECAGGRPNYTTTADDPAACEHKALETEPPSGSARRRNTPAAPYRCLRPFTPD